MESSNDDPSDDSEDEALGFLLGGINIADLSREAFENEESELDQPAENKSHLAGATTKTIVANKDASIPASNVQPYMELVGEDSEIFARSYQSGADGRLSRPPVKIVSTHSSGNGLVASRAIRRGEIIFTERAAEAIQLSSWMPSEARPLLRACQNCLCSLEPYLPSLPLPHLWPVPKYEGAFENVPGSTFARDKHGRIRCACNAIFCSVSCGDAFVSRVGACCTYVKAIRAIEAASAYPSISCGEATDHDFSTASEPQPAVILATRIFCSMVSHFRKTGELRLGSFRGICGSSNDVKPLELGIIQPGDPPIHTLEPIYDAMRVALSLKPNEQESCSFDFYCQLAAMAARNGFELKTQSPFSVYYSGLLRTAGRGSDRHETLVRDVAVAIGSEDGELRRGMDKEIEEKVSVRIAAIFSLTARINHSCEPCAEVRSQEFVDAHINLAATRNIEIGEEISISYINVGRKEGRKDRHRRCRELRAKYLFDCQCPKCFPL
jgi:hypothetical protein